MTKYTHYMDKDGEVYAVSLGTRPWGPGDREVAAFVLEDALPKVTKGSGGLKIEGLSGVFESGRFAGRPYEDWLLAFAAIIRYQNEEAEAKRQEAERQGAERVEREAKRLADLFNDIDPNPHGWYAPDKPLIRELVKRGVVAPPEES